MGELLRGAQGRWESSLEAAQATLSNVCSASSPVQSLITSGSPDGGGAGEPSNGAGSLQTATRRPPPPPCQRRALGEHFTQALN